jgi:hypothetical protein
MGTITLELEEHLAAALARTTEANCKPLPVWALERLKAAASEDPAFRNGYSAGYWKLFSSMEENPGFEAPDRGPARGTSSLDEP